MVRAVVYCSRFLTNKYGLKGNFGCMKTKLIKSGVGVWSGILRRQKFLSCALTDVYFSVPTSFHSYMALLTRNNYNNNVFGT